MTICQRAMANNPSSATAANVILKMFFSLFWQTLSTNVSKTFRRANVIFFVIYILIYGLALLCFDEHAIAIKGGIKTILLLLVYRLCI